MTASNNTPDNSRSLNLHSTLDLIEAVPMFVGYRPADSLVALYGNAAGRLDRAARIELSLDPVNLAYTVNKLTQLCREHDGSQAQTLHLIAYSDDTDTADQVLLFIADNWGRDRTPTDPSTSLATLASASTDHWAEINPNHPTAPTERTPYPTGTSELAADAVLAGIFQAYGTREELAATVTKPHPDDANVFAAQVDQATNSADTITNPAGMAQWMADWITNGYPRINTHQAAQLIAAVQDIHVRDAAWCHITAADALHHVNLWRDIAARVDGPGPGRSSDCWPPPPGSPGTAPWPTSPSNGPRPPKEPPPTACSAWSVRSSPPVCRPPCGPASEPTSPTSCSSSETMRLLPR